MDLIEKSMLTKDLELIEVCDFHILKCRHNRQHSQEQLEYNGEVFLKLPDRGNVVPTKEDVSVGQLELTIQNLEEHKENDDWLLM